jgi:hypothetical protein
MIHCKCTPVDPFPSTIEVVQFCSGNFQGIARVIYPPAGGSRGTSGEGRRARPSPALRGRLSQRESEFLILTTTKLENCTTSIQRGGKP